MSLIGSITANNSRTCMRGNAFGVADITTTLIITHTDLFVGGFVCHSRAYAGGARHYLPKDNSVAVVMVTCRTAFPAFRRSYT